MTSKLVHNTSNLQELWDILDIGLLITDLDNNVLNINNSARDLLNYQDNNNWGDYQASLQELLDVNLEINNKYSKQLTGIVGKPITAIIHRLENTKLIELQESYETRLGEASHELRRPLSNIKTLTDTLHLWGAGDDPVARPKFLKQLHEQVDRLTKMVNELLNLSRMQAGSIPLEFHQVTLYTMVEEIIEMLAAQASEKNISLVNNIPENYIIIADPDKIHHVVQNLIENAIRYNTQDGSVTIQPGEQSNSFVISDTGLGIKLDDQDKIFERFKRVQKEIPGTGLGLAIVKSIVDLHGGQILLESQENKGSSFTVILPEKNIPKLPS